MQRRGIRQLDTALAGRYAIEHEIGRGGMATVYLARDLKHHRHVAIKVLEPELAAVLGAERFLSEIRVTAHLQHPNLLPLFDSGEIEQPRWICACAPLLRDALCRGRVAARAAGSREAAIR